MQFLIVLSALVAVSMGGYLPGGLGLAGINHLAYAGAPVAYSSYSPVAASVQHHAQDALGQYNYGYADGLSTKNEVKTYDGVTRGGYSYVDANGQVQSVSYTADAINGFRVAATNLPQAPAPVSGPAPVAAQDTIEVAAAKSAHAAAHAEARARVGAAPSGEAPQPVQDTPEVSAAKAAHAAAHAAATVRNSIVPVGPIGYAAPGIVSVGPSGAFAYSSVAGPYLGYNGIVAPAVRYAGAPVVLTSQGVPVDTPEVQAARAANTVAHLQAKGIILG